MLPNQNPIKADLHQPDQDKAVEASAVPVEREDDDDSDENTSVAPKDVIMQDSVEDDTDDDMEDDIREEPSDRKQKAPLNEKTVPPAALPRQPLTTGDVEQDEWIRSRTNRVLELLEDDDMSPEPEAPREPEAGKPEPRETRNTPNRVETETPPPPEKSKEEVDQDAKNNIETLESIRATRRLFVRNLPYSATEDDLRDVFEKFGSLEEVSSTSKPAVRSVLSAFR